MPLSDVDVIRLRAEAIAAGTLPLRPLARQLGVAHSTLHDALLGKTFTHLNDTSPPVTTGLLARRTQPTAVGPAVIQEMADKRLSDPVKWSYRALADWCNTNHGTNYQPTNAMRLLDKIIPRVAAVSRTRVGESRAMPKNHKRDAERRAARASAPRRAAPEPAPTPVAPRRRAHNYEYEMPSGLFIPRGYVKVDISTPAARREFAQKFIEYRRSRNAR